MLSAQYMRFEAEGVAPRPLHQRHCLTQYKGWEHNFNTRGGNIILGVPVWRQCKETYLFTT